jgi:hypothetical protein
MKLSLCLIKQVPRHEDVWGTTVLDRGELSDSSPDRFTPGKDPHPGNNLIGDWVGPRAGPDAVEQRKISCPCRKSNPGRPARLYTD